MFHHNLNAILSLMIGVRPDRSSALYNAVLDVCVITDIYIIQNDGVFYVTIASNIVWAWLLLNFSMDENVEFPLTGQKPVKDNSLDQI